MSHEFNFEIGEKEAAAAIFMGRNHRLLVEAAMKAKRSKKITQQQIADKIGVHKSVISRALRGYNNLTERTLSDICWAIGVEPHLEISLIEKEGGNEPVTLPRIRAGVSAAEETQTKSLNPTTVVRIDIPSSRLEA